LSSFLPKQKAPAKYQDLVIRTRTLKETGLGAIQEVVFIGIPDHNWPAWGKTCDFIKDDFLKKNAAAPVPCQGDV
jgi:hypothetical protein